MGTPATESIADQSKEVVRIAAFSDGVFAIAITLLTLQLEVPRSGDLAQNLIDLGPYFLAFVISFLVIGLYWVAHHRLFAIVVRYDSRLIWLNLLAEHGDRLLGVIVYAASLAGASFANTALAAYALVGRRRCPPSTPTAVVRYYLWRIVDVAIYVTVSLLLLFAPTGTDLIMYSWLGIPVAQRLVGRHYKVS